MRTFPKSVLCDVSRCYARKVFVVNMFENHGFLYCRPLIVDFSFALFGDTDVSVSQTLVDHEILFFFFLWEQITGLMFVKRCTP